ncbi:hypothetical protein [Thalassospira sp.]|uniref:hypothetical protein n=1 Tax=Thalassospira sp. TaxID=1912094 RepID=UPI00273749AF|nr:hypothetical protein [Thalassospira sp.]MDP2700367.1 hypothetical protein [Thalassospira sp.]
MAFPPAGYRLAGSPAALSVSVSLHHHLFHLAPNAKTRKASSLAGFGPGGFVPLIFLLCHGEKNKSRTFFKNRKIIYRVRKSRPFSRVSPTSSQVENQKT